MTTVEVLTKALELLGPNGENWSKGWYAYDLAGSRVEPDSSQAIGWCMLGCVSRVASGPVRALDATRHLQIAISEISGSDIAFTRWNDVPSRMFPEVRYAFEKAIELAKSEAGQ